MKEKDTVKPFSVDAETPETVPLSLSHFLTKSDVLQIYQNKRHIEYELRRNLMEMEHIYFHSSDKLSHRFIRITRYLIALALVLAAFTTSFAIDYFIYNESFSISGQVAFGLMLSILWAVFFLFSACFLVFFPTHESVFLTCTSILVISKGLLCSQYTTRHPLSRRGGIKVEKITKSKGHLPESFYKPELLQDETTPLKSDALLTIRKPAARRNPFISFSVGNGDELVEALSIVSGSAPDHSAHSLLPSTICKVFLVVMFTGVVLLTVVLPLSLTMPSSFITSLTPVFALYGLLVIGSMLLILMRCRRYHHDFLFFISPQ